MNHTRHHHLPLCLIVLIALATPWSGGSHGGTPAAIGEEVRLEHISIIETGHGAPVVLIPGLSTPRAVWDTIAADLAGTRRVLRVQVNGFAGDDPGANLIPGILDGIVADLAHYIDNRHTGRVAVVGHSMGGLAGLLLAARHPDSVDRLMVVDGLPFFAIQMAAPGDDIGMEQVEPVARQMRDAVAAGHGQPQDPATIQARVAGMSLRSENHDTLAAWSLAADARVTAQALYENLTTDARPLLPSISTPITLVYPWSEQGLPRERLDAFYRRQYVGAGDIRFVAIGDAAHFVMLDQPAKFTDALTGFLQHTSQPPIDR